MARGFGTTFGVGSTDIIESSMSDQPSLASWFIWTYRAGDGGGGNSRIYIQSPSSGIDFFSNSGGNVYQWQYPFSGAIGVWTFPRPSTNVWSSVGVKFSDGSDTNNPTVYHDGTKLEVGSGLTEAVSPSGVALVLVGVPYTLGNRSSDLVRNWDGMLAEFAIWDVLLDDAEFGALADGFSPLLIRPESLREYLPLLRDNVSPKRAAAPTITGTAVQPHPRIIMPRKRRAPISTLPPPPEILFAQACL